MSLLAWTDNFSILPSTRQLLRERKKSQLFCVIDGTNTNVPFLLLLFSSAPSPPLHFSFGGKKEDLGKNANFSPT